MHGLEDGRVRAYVGARRHAQAAHQAGHQVGQDVAEQVGGDHGVELPGVEHELHRAGVDDHGLELELALVLLGVELLGRLQEDARERLHDVRLVHHRHLLAALRDGGLEGVVEDAVAALAGVDAGGHGHGVRVAVDAHVVLVADVQALEVLAHHQQVDVVEAAAGNDGARRAHVGEELELLAQAHVGAAVAAARGRLQRALERQARLADRIERGLGQRVAGGLHAAEAGDLGIPLEGRAQGVERGQGGVHDLGADAVAGDQGGRDAGGHLRFSLE